jgi:hypothetical protein
VKKWIVKNLNRIIDNIGARAMLKIGRYCSIRTCETCAISEACAAMRRGCKPGTWAPDRYNLNKTNNPN